MKNLFTLFILLSGLTTLAQDLPDYRKKNESYARLPKTEIRGDLATFTMSGIDESVGKAQLPKIAHNASGLDSMTFDADGIKAEIRTGNFDQSKRRLDYDEKTLIKIDKKPYYGNYGKIPKIYISRLTLMIGKDSIIIPPAAYADLFNPSLTYLDKTGIQRSRNGIFRSKDGKRIYIYLFCKDTSGSYEVTWIIQDKVYLKRVLDYGFM